MRGSDCEELVGVVDVFFYEFVILLNLFDVPVVLQIQVNHYNNIFSFCV